MPVQGPGERIGRGLLGEEGSEECFAVMTFTPKVNIVECVSEPDRSIIEHSYGLEYVRSNMDDEKILDNWNSKTKSEKEEINTKAYNETYAIFCTHNNLTKITKSGIKAPVFQANTEVEYCTNILSVENILDEE